MDWQFLKAPGWWKGLPINGGQKCLKRVILAETFSRSSLVLLSFFSRSSLVIEKYPIYEK